jgi:hypothetical protein
MRFIPVVLLPALLAMTACPKSPPVDGGDIGEGEGEGEGEVVRPPVGRCSST